MWNKMRAAAANEGFNGVCFTSTWMSDELEHLHSGGAGNTYRLISLSFRWWKCLNMIRGGRELVLFIDGSFQRLRKMFLPLSFVKS